MALFRRNGEPADVPNVHAHENTLTQRRSEIETQVGELRAKVATLEASKADAFLEARVEDGTAAAVELESARAELATLESIAAALLEAAQEVNRERQRLDLATRIEECRQHRDQVAEQCRRVMVDLPVVVAECQQLARTAQALDQEYKAAEMEMRTLQHNLAHFGEAQYDALPRFGTGSRIAAEWDRHPEYLALANGLWHTGLSNAPR